MNDLMYSSQNDCDIESCKILNSQENEFKNDKRKLNNQFVTVVEIDENTTTSKSKMNDFVTVVQIASDSGSNLAHQSKLSQKTLMEQIVIYRLPGEKLGMALKFEGGLNNDQLIDRLFIQSINPNSPASRVVGSLLGSLKEGDEIIEIEGKSVSSMTRVESVNALKSASVCFLLLIKRKEIVSVLDQDQINEFSSYPSSSSPHLNLDSKNLSSIKNKRGPPPPIPPRLATTFLTTNSKVISANECSVDKNFLKKRPSQPPPLPPRKQKDYDSQMSCFNSNDQDQCSAIFFKNQNQNAVNDVKQDVNKNDKFTSVNQENLFISTSNLIQDKSLMNKKKLETDSNLPTLPEFYLDSLSMHDMTMMGSDTDDTGSSVSTVIEKFSQNNVTNFPSSNGQLSSSPVLEIKNLPAPLKRKKNELDEDQTLKTLNKENDAEIFLKETFSDEQVLSNSQSTFEATIDDYDDIQSVSMNYDVNKHLDSIVEPYSNNFNKDSNETNKECSLRNELSYNNIKINQNTEQIAQPSSLETFIQKENLCTMSKSHVASNQSNILAPCQVKCVEKNKLSKSTSISDCVENKVNKNLNQENFTLSRDETKNSLQFKVKENGQLKSSRSLLTLSLIPKRLKSSKSVSQAASQKSKLNSNQIAEADARPSLIPRPIVKPLAVLKTKIPVRRAKSIDNFKCLEKFSCSSNSINSNGTMNNKKLTNSKLAKSKKVVTKELVDKKFVEKNTKTKLKETSAFCSTASKNEKKRPSLPLKSLPFLPLLPIQSMIDLCDTIGIELKDKANSSLLNLHSSTSLNVETNFYKDEIIEMEELKEFIEKEIKCKESESLNDQNLDFNSKALSKSEQNDLKIDLIKNSSAEENSISTILIQSTDQNGCNTNGSSTSKENALDSVNKSNFNLTSSSSVHQLQNDLSHLKNSIQSSINNNEQVQVSTSLDEDADPLDTNHDQSKKECIQENDQLSEPTKTVKERIAMLEQKGSGFPISKFFKDNKVNHINPSEMNKNKLKEKLDSQIINSKKDGVLEDSKTSGSLLLDNRLAYKTLSQSSDVINNISKVTKRPDLFNYSKSVSSNLSDFNLSINDLSNSKSNYDCHFQPSYRRFTSYDSIVGLPTKSNKPQSSSFLINSMIDKKLLNSTVNCKLKGLVIREPQVSLSSIIKPLPTIVSSSVTNFHNLESQSQEEVSSFIKDQQQKENNLSPFHTSNCFIKPIQTENGLLVQDFWSSAKNIIPKYSPAFKRRSLQTTKLLSRSSFNDSGISSIASTPDQSPASVSSLGNKSETLSINKSSSTSVFDSMLFSNNFSKNNEKNQHKFLECDLSDFVKCSKKENTLNKLNNSLHNFTKTNIESSSLNSANKCLSSNLNFQHKNEFISNPSFKQLTKTWKKLTAEDSNEKSTCSNLAYSNFETRKIKDVTDFKTQDDLNAESKKLDQTQLLSFNYTQGSCIDNNLNHTGNSKIDINQFEEKVNNTEDNLIKTSENQSTFLKNNSKSFFPIKSLDFKYSTINENKLSDSSSDDGLTNCFSNILNCNKKDSETKLDLENFLEVKVCKSSKLEEMNEVDSKYLSNDSGNSSPEGCNSIGYTSSNVVSRANSVSNLRDSQYGSVSSLASSTSLISPQELQILIDEANQSLEGEIASQANNIQVVVLHREYNTSGSIGITLAGGVDYETKEITVHKVIAGSIADRDGRIKKGDRILSINGKILKGATHKEALNIMKSPRPEVVFVLSSNSFKSEHLSSLDSKYFPNDSNHNKNNDENLERKDFNIDNNYKIHRASLIKDGAGVGFILEGGKDSTIGDSKPLAIKRIFTGGPADKEGTLMSGDEILAINDYSAYNMTRTEAWNFLKKLPDGIVKITVRRKLYT